MPAPQNEKKQSNSSLPAVGAKSATYLPLKDKLTLFALLPSELTMEGGDKESALLLQDDNLLTHASCTVQDGAPCVIDVLFSEPASVSAIRLFTGDCSSRKAFTASGKAKRVRIQSDGGQAEATLDEHWDYSVISLDSPLTTKYLRIEILSIHAAKKKTEVAISELDILGEKGVPRPPLYTDWERLYTKTDGDFWRKSKFNDSWIEQVDIKGNRQRLFRGSTVHGRSGRRFLLAERLVSSTCPGAVHYQESRYTLIDTQGRVFYSLPQLTKGLTTITPRNKGEGFLIKGYSFADEEIYQTLLFDNDQVLNRQFDLSRDPNDLNPQALARLGFSKDVLSFSYSGEYGNPKGAARPCKPMKRMSPAVRKAAALLKLDKETFNIAYWEKCEIPDKRTVYLMNDMCNETHGAAVVVQQLNGDIQAKAFSTYAEADLRVFSDGSVKISAERKSQAGGDIYNLEDDGTLKLLIKDALFHPGPDPDCRCSA